MVSEEALTVRAASARGLAVSGAKTSPIGLKPKESAGR
jgi:hypothetical protein